MVEFLTLLLGLVAGPQVVELSAGDEVAAIRLLLDGEEIAVDASPPWKLELDLGATLRPRLLTAVAYDDRGAEVGRAVQRLNIPRAPAEVRIAFERDAAGAARAALVTWESTVGVYPLRSRAWFDGEPLDALDPARVALPAHDERGLHLFQIELEFTSDVIAKGQAVLGGRYLDEARAELTALPVFARGRGARARPAQMQGWFTVAEPGAAPHPARVVAYEKGGLDLVLVRGPGVSAAMEDLEGALSEDLTAGGVASGAAASGVEGSSPSAMLSVANTAVASAAERLQRVMALEKGQRLRIMAPRARRQAGRTVAMELFALSPEISQAQGGLYWALGQRVDLPGLSPELRLADAVAVAGAQAANGHRRRAVLLVVAEPGVDESRHAAAAVREYLASIHVPLQVWRVGAAASTGAWEEWGPGEEITDFRQLQAAARKLADGLDRQRIVWLEGLFLPTSVGVGGRAGVEAIP